MFIVWELNTLCNMKCVYCHVKGDNPGYPTEIIERTLLKLQEWLPNGSDLDVFWTGGEPTLRQDIVTGLAEKCLKQILKIYIK